MNEITCQPVCCKSIHKENYVGKKEIFFVALWKKRWWNQQNTAVTEKCSVAFWRCGVKRIITEKCGIEFYKELDSDILLGLKRFSKNSCICKRVWVVIYSIYPPSSSPCDLVELRGASHRLWPSSVLLCCQHTLSGTCRSGTSSFKLMGEVNVMEGFHFDDHNPPNFQLRCTSSEIERKNLSQT